VTFAAPLLRFICRCGLYVFRKGEKSDYVRFTPVVTLGATRHMLRACTYDAFVQTGLNNTPRVIAHRHTVHGYNMPRRHYGGGRQRKKSKISLCSSVIISLLRHTDCPIVTLALIILISLATFCTILNYNTEITM